MARKHPSPADALDPRAIRGSPEALAQEAEVVSIFAKYTHLRVYLPTIASLAAKRSPVALALAHGRVLRAFYQMDYQGVTGNHLPHPSEVYRYLTGVLDYLCKVKAGILMRREPILTEGIILSDPEAPAHLRDARIALTKLMTYTPPRDWAHPIPHRQILALYLDHGYFSDSPSSRMARPDAPFASWIEQAIDNCNPNIIEALVERGVDLDEHLTYELLERKRTSLRITTSWNAEPWYRTPRYRQLEFVQPGDFVGYFKICSFTGATGTWEQYPHCVEVVKQIEAARMNRQIEVAMADSMASPSTPSAAAAPRRRAAL